MPRHLIEREIPGVGNLHGDGRRGPVSHGSRRERVRRVRREGMAGILAALVLGAVACSDRSPFEPGLPEPCELATLGVGSFAAAPEPARLLAALTDAETRVAAGLGSSAAADVLRGALSALRASGPGSDAELCTAFNAAAGAVAAWDAVHGAADPGRPDFAVIVQTLTLYETSIRTHRGFGAGP